jgi:hypothetical protein
MYEEQATRSQMSTPAQSDEESENPMPDVPFEAIAAVLGLLVLVLIAVAAYSLAESLNAFSVSPQLWAPAIFMLLVSAGFWAVSRFQQRTHTR